MQIDLERLTHREIEDAEEYVGRPVLGHLRRALAKATGPVHDENGELVRDDAGEPLMTIDDNILLDELPGKILNALSCIERRREDPTFTIDKWADARFGDEPEPPSAEPVVDPTPAAIPTPPEAGNGVSPVPVTSG
jgi:hypothetical protein